ncbi:erythromycin esterase family protein [Hymenobacter jeollabukensis]|uniref:Erythromycin esterase family protein n=1 Tax=Hymenobacter jeollabukensis TaxID=2025313 RepID=A0A5R8WLY5_9BACT|nr:erythromycin esterase family protein [Hymenobacter jeollabukensis]TLM89827.1 erythromycin esterase family protein [Hymenobacter jeollabukensis]
MRFLSILVLLLASLTAHGQAILNLDFEPEANHRRPLLLWSRRQHPDDLLIRLDTTSRAQHGRGSLLIDASRAEEPEGTFVSASFPVTDSLRGQIVTFTVWVRTEEFVGHASFQGYSGRQNENLSSNRNDVAALTPTADWQPLRTQVPVSREAESVSVSLYVNGRGRIWLDNYQMHRRGQPYVDAPLPGTEALLLPPGTPLPDWDFERRGPAEVRGPQAWPRRWQLDSAVVQHGRRSLRVPAASPDAAPVYLGVVPLDSLQDKTLTIRGYVRYAAAAGAPAQLRYRLISNSDRLAFPYDRFKWIGQLAAAPLPAPAATPGWQPFELKIPVAEKYNLSELTLLLQPGATAVWLDHLELLVNGHGFTPTAPPTPGLPTAAELAWLRKAAVPLRTTAPDGGDQKDLAAFGQLVGTSKVIGLGEVTLGSHEQMQLKHRLFRYLVEQKGVRLLALEADLGPCLALNDYLQTGQGDPKALVAELPAWDTAEMLALVQWMRSYNQRAPGPKLQLLGLDLQEAPAGLRYLRPHLPASPNYRTDKLTELQARLRELEAANVRLHLLKQPDAPAPLLTDVRRLLAELRTAYELPAKLSSRYQPFPGEAVLLPQLLRVAEQFSLYHTLAASLRPSYRAACLAENLQWARQQTAGGKAVVWSHNESLTTYNRDDETLGMQLRRQYGPDFLAVGLAFHEGTFRALRAEEPPAFVTATAAPSAVGSYEHYFRAAALPAALLDIRTPELLPGTQWLYENLQFREGTLKAYIQPFGRHSLRREFDALLYLPKSTPAQAVQ